MSFGNIPAHYLYKRPLGKIAVGDLEYFRDLRAIDISAQALYETSLVKISARNLYVYLISVQGLYKRSLDKISVQGLWVDFFVLQGSPKKATDATTMDQHQVLTLTVRTPGVNA